MYIPYHALGDFSIEELTDEAVYQEDDIGKGENSKRAREEDEDYEADFEVKKKARPSFAKSLLNVSKIQRSS